MARRRTEGHTMPRLMLSQEEKRLIVGAAFLQGLNGRGWVQRDLVPIAQAIVKRNKPFLAGAAPDPVPLEQGKGRTITLDAADLELLHQAAAIEFPALFRRSNYQGVRALALKYLMPLAEQAILEAADSLKKTA